MMKKAEFLKKEGLKIRKATAKDKACAKTDYQRNSNFIIKTKSGKEYFSKNGSIADCKTIIKFNTTKPKKQSSRKEKVIRNYTEKDGTKIRIIKAANGKYFNEYTSHKAGAGPFETFKDAEIMLKKHRPTAIRSIKKQVKKNK